jgi:hypothetical protein
MPFVGSDVPRMGTEGDVEEMAVVAFAGMTGGDHTALVTFRTTASTGPR